jgi:NADH:ubiquinone oxidoreductase subunit 5 (subunit L)/multisubunit Na+/H+ antiporter MnhA subunit
VVLAFFAVVAGWSLPVVDWGVATVLEQARPAGTALGIAGRLVTVPAEHVLHPPPSIHIPVSFIAFFTALAGFVLATAFYGLRRLDPEDARRMFASIDRFLRRKWLFDELYDAVFVRPVLWIARAVAAVDTRGIDVAANGLAWATRQVAGLDDLIDRAIVDGLVNGIARRTYRIGLGLRSVQTGNLRQYVMWIAVGTVALFVLVSLIWDFAIAG